MTCPGVQTGIRAVRPRRREPLSGLVATVACAALGAGLAWFADQWSRHPTGSGPEEQGIPAAEATPASAPPRPGFPLPSQATFRGDSGLTGVFADPAPAAPVGIRWRISAHGTPAGGLVWDGRRFLVALAEGVVIAVAPDGTELWRRGAGLDGIAAPPVVVGTRCVAVSPAGTFAAFDTESGEVLWRTTAPVDFAPRAAPAILGDSLIAALSQTDGRLLALDATTGTVRWTGEPVTRCDGAPGAAGGRLVFGHCNAALEVFEARTGTPLATLPLGDDAQVAGPVAVRDGLTCCGTRNGEVVLVDLEGPTLRWRTRVGEAEVFSAPVLTGDAVVVTTADAQVVALSATEGRERWRHATGRRSATSPILTADGSVVVGASGTVLALSLETGQLLWSLPVGDATTEPVAAAGLVVVGTDEGDVVALGTRGPNHPVRSPQP